MRSIKEQIKSYQEQFKPNPELKNSAGKGIELGGLRTELIPQLEKRLGESPNFMKAPLGEFKTSPSGHKYHPIFKSKK